MSMSTRTVLGIDASTQSLSAVLLQANTGEILWSRSLAYRDDPRLAGFGFEHDTMIIPPREPGEAEQPPRLFIAALEALFADLKAAGFDTSAIAAINTSGQQHGHVYLNDQAKALFARLRDTASAKDTLLSLLGDSFAYGGAPIWKTANTAAEAEHIRQAVGGKEAIIRLTGSDMPLRFSVTVHRKLAIRYPAAYAATRHILQISSFIPAILAGDCTIPIDRVPLAVNARLPADIAVVDAVAALEDFNAIGSCIQKEYVYQIYNSRIRDAFLEHRVCFYPQLLDFARLARAGCVCR